MCLFIFLLLFFRIESARISSLARGSRIFFKGASITRRETGEEEEKRRMEKGIKEEGKRREEKEKEREKKRLVWFFLYCCESEKK